MLPSDFDVLENVQAITQQIYTIEAKVIKLHDTAASVNSRKSLPLATTQTFSRLKNSLTALPIVVICSISFSWRYLRIFTIPAIDLEYFPRHSIPENLIRMNLHAKFLW